jgi:hypothetical protein
MCAGRTPNAKYGKGFESNAGNVQEFTMSKFLTSATFLLTFCLIGCGRGAPNMESLNEAAAKLEVTERDRNPPGTKIIGFSTTAKEITKSDSVTYPYKGTIDVANHSETDGRSSHMFYTIVMGWNGQWTVLERKDSRIFSP